MPVECGEVALATGRYRGAVSLGSDLPSSAAKSESLQWHTAPDSERLGLCRNGGVITMGRDSGHGRSREKPNVHDAGA